jgi:hypothetical protein
MSYEIAHAISASLSASAAPIFAAVVAPLGGQYDYGYPYQQQLAVSLPGVVAVHSTVVNMPTPTDAAYMMDTMGSGIPAFPPGFVATSASMAVDSTSVFY